ncbi:MAG: hypothetical protein RHS_5489 [Robinsoniella sp. RHS]|nr:MAG: hypothetical protein RHS_5489 [Robinsoniella sp. RHS]
MDKNVPIAVIHAITRLLSGSILIRFIPYATPIVRLSRLAEIANKNADKKCIKQSHHPYNIRYIESYAFFIIPCPFRFSMLFHT